MIADERKCQMNERWGYGKKMARALHCTVMKLLLRTPRQKAPASRKAALSPRASMKAVAEQAGVSIMTVSRVFRNEPCVRPEQRDRIRTIAKNLGYEPDIWLGRYLSLAKQKKTHETGSVLALLHCVTGCEKAPLAEQLPLAVLTEKAHRANFKVEVFTVEDSEASVAQTRRILWARGIRAVLLASHPRHHAIRSFDFSPFVVVSIGCGLNGPGLNVVGTDILAGFRKLLSSYRDMNFRRPGLAISHRMDLQVDHGFSSALLGFQGEIPSRDRVTPFWLEDANPTAQKDQFLQWLQKHRPDLVVGPADLLTEWMNSCKVPADCRPLIISADRSASINKGPGIDHRRDLVCQFAIDLVTMGLVSNQTGIPQNPFRMLVAAEFTQD